MIKEILKYSILNIWHRKLRSFLSVLSIVIGIMAIVALSSFGIGIQDYIEDMAKKMGTDKLMVMPRDYMSAGGETNVVLNENDLEFLEKIKGVNEVTGMMMSIAKIKFKNYQEIYPYVMGMSTDSKAKILVEEMFAGYGVGEGRNLEKGDVLKVVLGYNYLVPDKAFKKAISVGDKIEINDVELKVVGFYEEIGNPADDLNVYLSLEGYEEIFGNENYFFILLRATPNQDSVKLADRVKEKFRKHRDQKEGEEDFFVQTYEEMIATYGAVTDILIIILVLIALISVFVAAVNIANTMYTSVLERTKEIGVMKSIGAKNKFILFIFVVESGILGLVGGIIGVYLGYLVAKGGGMIAASQGLAMLKPAFPLWLMGGSLLFAFLVGAFSGLLPAIGASKQKPVDSLRYE